MDQGYVLEKKIGDGSFGKVYQGHNKSDKKPVAIKIIDLEQVEDELEEIQKEIRVLSDCDCDQQAITRLFSRSTPIPSYGRAIVTKREKTTVRTEGALLHSKSLGVVP